MAISTPTDLVMDVVQAADPNQLQAAREKLKTNQASNEAMMLASNGVGFPQAVTQSIDNASPVDNLRVGQKQHIPETYRKFEASVASTFIQNMMPSDSEDVYGKGAAGDFWKGMMAEQIADQVSKQGGFGIAKKLYEQSLQHARGQVPNATTNEKDRQMAISMITDIQRQVLSPGMATDTQTHTAKKTNV